MKDLKNYLDRVASKEELIEGINDVVMDLAMTANEDNAHTIADAANLLKTFKDILNLL